MTSLRPRLAVIGLVVAAAALTSGSPVAVARAIDPVPPQKPLVGPLAVPPQYRDLAKLQDVVLGRMAIEPLQGDLDSLITFTTAGGCPRGSNTVTRIYGPKLPAGGQNVIGNNYTYDFGSPPADSMKAPMTITLREVIARQPAPVDLDGSYRIWMQCQNADMDDFSVNFGVFEGKMTIHDGRYTSLTRPADLPKRPAPKTGPEAFAALDAKLNAPAPPTPLAGALEAQNLAASAAGSQDSNVTALAVTGGILALGLIPLAWVQRRRTTTTGKR